MRAIPGSPLIVGVSGHRDLHPDAVADLESRVAGFLRELKERVPGTQLRMLIGMAQGADLLVARLALDAGIPVDAVLPMPLEPYLEDFDPASAAAMQLLLQHPLATCTALTPPADSPAAGDRFHPVQRTSRYAHLAQVMVEKSSLLLALWDGRSSLRAGGTADTVLRYLGARVDEGGAHRELQMVDAGTDTEKGSRFVFWIPTTRSDGVAPPSTLTCYLSGVGDDVVAVHRKMPRELKLQLEELDNYNHEFGQLHAQGEITRLDTLMPAVPSSLPAATLRTLKRIDTEYGRADALAIYCQQRSDRMFRWFSYMAFLMGVAFLVYAKLLPNKLLLYVYAGILAANLLTFYLIKDRNWFARHLVYRVLAETLRTKFYLHMAGAGRRVNAAELIELTGIDQFSGFSWIGIVLKNVEATGQEAKGRDDDAAGIEAAREHWIRDQRKYFTRKVHALERKHGRLEHMKGGLIYLLMILTGMLVVFAHGLEDMHVGDRTLKDVAVFLMGLLPVCLGIWELYQNKMAMRELLWQYRNQHAHFTSAELRLGHTTIPERQRAILAEVGQRSLMESFLWTIHRFHREHEPPSAA